MATRNPTAFCPHCKQRVLLVREDINWPLAIVLLIFTAGIGLVIYLIIYYSGAENRCIHCHTPIMMSNLQYAQQTHQNAYQSEANFSPKKDASLAQPNYCPFCGEHLSSKDAKFCSNCGSTL
jgi:hypothetical protein